MRMLVFAALAACSSARTPLPPSAASPAPSDPTAHATPAPPLRREVAERLARADLVVRGVLHVGSTRDGHLGSIEVAAVLRGAAPPTIGFVSGPLPYDETPQIYFLQRQSDDAGRYRLIDQGDRLGLAAAVEASVIAEVAATSQAEWSAALAAVAEDVERFRTAAGRPWTPAQQAAVAAARKIFATVPMIGIPAAEIERTLGPPTEKLPDGRWSYTRHDGEVGTIRILRFVDDRAAVIEIHLTQ